MAPQLFWRHPECCTRRWQAPQLRLFPSPFPQYQSPILYSIEELSLRLLKSLNSESVEGGGHAVSAFFLYHISPAADIDVFSFPFVTICNVITTGTNGCSIGHRHTAALVNHSGVIIICSICIHLRSYDEYVHEHDGWKFFSQQYVKSRSWSSWNDNWSCSWTPVYIHIWYECSPFVRWPPDLRSRTILVFSRGYIFISVHQRICH